MKWHTEALPKGCLEAADHLKPFPWLAEFYLAGGTALALRYGHRLSVDLDFFSSTNGLDFIGREPILESLQSLGAVVEEQKDGTIHTRLGKTHVSFFRYRYPLLRPLLRWGPIRLAGPIDIGLMKVGAIIGRGSKKDFVDLYLVLNEHIALPKLLRLAAKKFSTGPEFLLQACRALVYFDDAERESMPTLRSDLSWDRVKQFFESEVRKLARPFR